MAKVPGASDLQSLMANWYRLHPSDAAMAVFLGGHLLAALGIERTSGTARKWAVGGLAAALLIIAVSIKPTAICLTLPLVGYGVIQWISRNRQNAIVTVVAGVTSFLLSALLLLLVINTAQKATPGSYGQSYALTVENLRSGVTYFAGAWWHLLGPVAIWLAFSLVFRNVVYWASGIELRELVRRNAAPLYLILCWISLTSVYVPWPQHLPRYLVTGLVPLSGLIALEWALHVELLSAGKTRVWATLASFLGGIVAILALPLTLLGGIFVVLIFWAWRKPAVSRFVGIGIAGIGIVGIFFLLATGLASAKAIHENYCAREFQQARLTKTAETAFRNGATIGFLGDATDEHVGSLCGKISRDGVEPRVRSIDKETNMEGVSMLLVSQALSPDDSIPKPCKWQVTDVFGPDKPTVQVPYDFWTWRRRVWHAEPLRLTTPQSLKWTWTLYSQR